VPHFGTVLFYDYVPNTIVPFSTSGPEKISVSSAARPEWHGMCKVIVVARNFVPGGKGWT
jgi:hypothetical protein